MILIGVSLDWYVRFYSLRDVICIGLFNLLYEVILLVFIFKDV